jgi:DNA-binding transcriptional MocR family regulator
LALKILAKRHDIRALLRYPPAEGWSHHRLDGVQWINTMGLKAEPESVVLAAGAQQGLSLILSAMTKPGDLIMTEALTYPGVKAIAEFLNLKILGIAMDQEGILPEDLEAVCRRRKAKVLFCMPDLHNPTSVILSLKRREALASLARRYDLLIIEDAIHRPFLDDPLPTLAQLAPEHTFFLASVSKSVAAGLRIAFILAPALNLGRLRQAVAALTLYSSSLPFEIFSFWIEHGIVESTIRERKSEIEKRNKLTRKILAKQMLQTHPRSNFLWLTLPPEMKCSRFTLDAYRSGVIVSPADVFAVDDKQCPEAVRICPGAAQDQAVLQKGLKIIEGILAGKKIISAETV